jgi:hypothetical protein
VNINPLDAAVSVANTIIGVVGEHFPSETKKAEVQAQIQKLVEDALNAREAQISARWEADLKSDSWLAKNTRPLMYWSLFTLWVTEGFFAAFDKPFPEAYVSLTANALIAVLGAYVVMRGAEKISTAKYSK